MHDHRDDPLGGCRVPLSFVTFNDVVTSERKVQNFHHSSVSISSTTTIRWRKHHPIVYLERNDTLKHVWIAHLSLKEFSQLCSFAARKKARQTSTSDSIFFSEKVTSNFPHLILFFSVWPISFNASSETVKLVKLITQFLNWKKTLYASSWCFCRHCATRVWASEVEIGENSSEKKETTQKKIYYFLNDFAPFISTDNKQSLKIATRNPSIRHHKKTTHNSERRQQESHV